MFGLAKKKELTDEQMMENFQKGDSGAFEQLLNRYGSKILYFIMKKLNMTKPVAEDLMQEIFIKVIEKRDTFNTERKFSTWLYAVANNRCIDYMRRDKNKQTSSLDKELSADAGGTTHLELVKSETANPEEYSYNKEIKVCVDEGVCELREEVKEVFLLREIEGLSLNEIAEITGAPLNTVKTRLRTAYLNLREHLISSGCFAKEQNLGSVK
ncbi:MAG: sigma-70 family RNA polymerase sigma factor [Candidatus Dadabacteria bacterium]|nr:sigma-70 family RNA polymerase sigma factor [Candidatus Dadabacteria bacterium]NIS08810.1 sigma-70 family RNA polymerase sigma factor [Candidatus Dadabacteria bacterium]NIY22160.1 sigma-70 family RNA polymerase sigma factor [Candidatus Dadabacteria bacterium]